VGVLGGHVWGEASFCVRDVVAYGWYEDGFCPQVGVGPEGRDIVR